MKIAFEIGIVTFGRIKTIYTGFEIFQKSGIVKHFGNDNLSIALQLPSGIELFENTEVFSVVKVNNTYSSEEFVAISAYRYSGFDRDNRKTYFGAAIFYKNKGFYPSADGIIPLLTKLLNYSNQQQTKGIERIELEMESDIILPAFSTVINGHLNKSSFFVVFENEKKKTIENFLTIAQNKYYSNIQRLFFSVNPEIIKSVELEKLNVDFEQLNHDLIEDYQKEKEHNKIEFESLQNKYSAAIEETHRLRKKMSQAEIETMQLREEKEISINTIQQHEQTIQKLRELLKYRIESNKWRFSNFVPLQKKQLTLMLLIVLFIATACIYFWYKLRYPYLRLFF